MKQESVRSFGVQNCMPDQKNISLGAYADRLKGRERERKDRQEKHDRCEEAYHNFVAQQDEEQEG